MAMPTWYEEKKETTVIINGEKWYPESSLRQTDNSGYAKLPSLEDVKKEVQSVNEVQVEIVYLAIKKLGKFA